MNIRVGPNKWEETDYLQRVEGVTNPRSLLSVANVVVLMGTAVLVLVGESTTVIPWSHIVAVTWDAQTK